MLFDPDAGRTTEEIIQRKWDEWTDEKRARILAVAKAEGCTWFDVVCECIEQYLDAFNDPITGQRMKARLDYAEAPCGKDPRVTAAGDQ
jgi:hypothetical protein